MCDNAVHSRLSNTHTTNPVTGKNKLHLKSYSFFSYNHVIISHRSLDILVTEFKIKCSSTVAALQS